MRLSFLKVILQLGSYSSTFPTAITTACWTRAAIKWCLRGIVHVFLITLPAALRNMSYGKVTVTASQPIKSDANQALVDSGALRRAE